MQYHSLSSTQGPLLHAFSCMSLKWICCCLGRIAEPVGKSVLWLPPLHIPFQPTVPLASRLAPNECPLKHLSGSFPSGALLFGGAKQMPSGIAHFPILRPLHGNDTEIQCQALMRGHDRYLGMLSPAMAPLS